MYHEAWRIERDFFYDPRLPRPRSRRQRRRSTSRISSGIASRDDLNYLFEEMLGELTVGHMFVGGGDSRSRSRCRAACSAPTTRSRTAATASRGLQRRELEPGAAGAADAAGRQRQGGRVPARGQRPRAARDATTSTASSRARPASRSCSGSARTRTARARAKSRSCRWPSEEQPAHLAWIEDNRRKVDQVTGGTRRLRLPAGHGRRRLHELQPLLLRAGRQGGAIIDERFNGGGQLADYIIDYLRRPLMSRSSRARANDWSSPRRRSSGRR